MTPAEEETLLRIAAFEAAYESISAADYVIEAAKGLEARTGKTLEREERVATIAKFFITVNQDANPLAIFIVAARAVDRLLEAEK